MALIKCPECKKKISNTAEKCPHCGFDVQRYLESARDNKGVAKPKINNSLEQSIKKLISFEWVDTFLDALIDIPIIGGLLYFLVLFIPGCAIVVGLVILFLWIMELLTETSPTLAMMIMLIGANVISFFASYRWGKRKPWFFWVGLIISLFFSFNFLCRY